MTNANTNIQEARTYVHENIAEILNLRKITLKQMESDSFREHTRSIIKKTLKSHTAFSNHAENQQLLDDIFHEVVGLGPIDQLLCEENVSEIMINGHREIFVEKHGCIEKTSLSFTNEISLRNVINRILSPLGRRVDESSPMVDARLPDGSRFNAVIPPLSLKGPVVTIRKFSKKWTSFEQLIASGSLSKASARFLNLCVIHRQNILISGGTGSGKTTLLNLLSSFIHPQERIVTIEDAAELQLKQPHVISLESRPENIEGKGQITIRDLLRNALRMRPDRIIVGECRGEETLDMLQAMNTGHEGSITTLHANSARDALIRLETLVLLSGYELPLQAIRRQIVSALDFIISVKRDRLGQRKIESITEVCGIDQQTILAHDIFSREPASNELVYKKMIPKFMQSFSNTEKQNWQKVVEGA